MDFVAIDFEIAMEKHWSACAIAIVPVKNGIIGETIYRLIRPPELKFGHIQIGKHGITANDVKDAPTLDQLWPEISHHIMGTLVIAHCAASADMSILRQSLEAVGVPVPPISFLCSRDLSRELWPKELWPNLPNHKLDTLCEFHSIPLEHHHAGSDARAAAQLILLGFKERGVNCPHELALSCGVSIRVLGSDDSQATCQSFSGNEATIPPLADQNEGLVNEAIPRIRKSRTKNDRPEICFSGFSKSDEELVEAFAEKHGYTCKDTVTVNLAILIKGPNVGPSKMKKAQAQGCQILTEPEFRNMVESFPTEQWWKE